MKAKPKIWRLNDLVSTEFETHVLKTKNEFFNKWFSIHGGIVTRSLNFITGNPGAGKTTFSFLLANIIEKETVLYYSREMDKEGLSVMLKKFKGYENKNVVVADKNSIPTIEEVFDICEKQGISVVFIDSLQIILSEDYGNQKDESAFKLFYERVKKFLDKNLFNTVFIIGHVTKNNQYKGRTIIQHMVDTHMEIIYNKEKNIREINFIKNRFGGDTNKYELSFENEPTTQKMEKLKIMKEGNVITDINITNTTTTNKNFWQNKKETKKQNDKDNIFEKIEDVIISMCDYINSNLFTDISDPEYRNIFKQYFPNIDFKSPSDEIKLTNFVDLLEDKNFKLNLEKKEHQEIFRFIVAVIMTYLIKDYKK